VPAVIGRIRQYSKGVPDLCQCENHRQYRLESELHRQDCFYIQRLGLFVAQSHRWVEDRQVFDINLDECTCLK
jgi:hypothetical protein